MIRTSEPELVANLARLLYWCDKAADADELLNLVSTVTSPTELPALMAALDSPDLARVLLQKIAVHRPAESLLQVIHVLRRVSPFKVDQLLNDVSCFRPPDRIPPVLEGLSEQETQHVLKATRAVRGPNGCNDLAQALRRAGHPQREIDLLGISPTPWQAPPRKTRGTDECALPAGRGCSRTPIGHGLRIGSGRDCAGYRGGRLNERIRFPP